MHDDGVTSFQRLLQQDLSFFNQRFKFFFFFGIASCDDCAVCEQNIKFDVYIYVQIVFSEA